MNTVSFIMRKRKAELAVSVILLVMGTIGVIVIAISLALPEELWNAIYLPFIAWIGYLFYLQKGQKMDVIAADGKACIDCMYDLSLSKPEGVCPECGKAYSIEQNINLWRSRFTWPYPEDIAAEHADPVGPPEQNESNLL